MNINLKSILAVMLVSVWGCAAPSIKAPEDVSFTGSWIVVPELSGRPDTLPAIKQGWLLTQLQSRRLDIFQRDDAMLVTYDDGPPPHVYPWGVSKDGSLKSGWDGRDFVLVTKEPGVGELVRKFILADEGKSLTLVMTLNKEAVTMFYRREQTAPAESTPEPADKGADNP